MVYTTQQRREIVLRFTPGDRVECMFTGTWVKATVHSCWYKEPTWPTDTWAPYQLKLDDGNLIFAPADDDRVVRRAADVALEAKPIGSLEETPTMAVEFGALRLSDSMLDLCGTDLPSPSGSVDAAESSLARARSVSLASVGSVGSLCSLPRASDSIDSKASLWNMTLPNMTEPSDNLFSDAPTADDSMQLPSMSTHGPAIPQLFSADEGSLIFEEVSQDMHISPASASPQTSHDPWCSGLSPLPSVGEAERSQGAARVYKMSLARSMTDEAEQFRPHVLQQADCEQHQQPVQTSPFVGHTRGPTVVPTSSLKLPDGQWTAFATAAQPALTPAANFQFVTSGKQQHPDPNGFLTSELRAAATRGAPRPGMRLMHEKQLARLRDLQEMLMHARAEFGIDDKRYQEVRRRVVACEAGLATFYDGQALEVGLNPLSVSKQPGTAPSASDMASSTWKRAQNSSSGATTSSGSNAASLGCQPKVKKKRVVPPNPDRKKATPWSEKELSDFRTLLEQEGPGDWKGKAARLGTGRSVKSLHTRWLRDEGRIIDLPRHRDPAKRASALQKATKGIAHITSSLTATIS